MKSELSMQVDLSRRMTRSGLILVRYAEGYKVEDIADEFDCTVPLFSGWRGWQGCLNDPRVLQELKGGVAYKVIARRNRVSPAYISKLAKATGNSRYDV